VVAHHRALAARAASFSEEVLDKQLGLTWIGSGFDFLVQTRLNTYTRDQEDKADLLGLQYIVAAGYDPYVAPRAVHQLSGGRHTQSEWTNFFKGKHPTSQSRIWRLNNLIKAYFYNVDIANARRSTPAYDRATARYREKSEADT
jgi:predicted Zn-dependent protease